MSKAALRSVITIAICLGSYGLASAQTKTADEINKELSASRKKIDSLDKLLINVLGNRQRVVREIGFYKKQNKVPALQPARFKQVVDKAIIAGQQEGLSPEFITELMNAIHKESLRLKGDTTAKH